MAQLDYPIRPNAKGGFDILLKQSLTSPAVSATAAVPAANEPPDMAGAQASMVGPENAGGQDWMSAVGEAAKTHGVSVPAGLKGARAQYTPPPDMGGGPLGKMLPAGMGDTLAGVAGGMNTIDRNQSPLAGFAAGMSGAMTARETRRKDKRAEMLELEDRQWKKEDRLYNRGIEGEKLKLLRSADERAADAAKLGVVESLSSIELRKAQTEQEKLKTERLAASSGLTAEERVALVKTADEIHKRMVGDDFELDPDAEPGAEGSIEYFQQTYQEARELAYQQVAGGGGAPGNTGTNTKAAGSSADSPVQWVPGQSPKTEAEFISQADAAVAANGGKPVYIKNPKTGQVGLYPAAAR